MRTPEEIAREIYQLDHTTTAINKVIRCVKAGMSEAYRDALAQARTGRADIISYFKRKAEECGG